MSTKTATVDILVEFHLKPGVQEAFEAILLPHLERVATEPACLMMIASIDSEDATRYLLSEGWADKEEFLTIRMNRSYRIPYNKAVAPMEASPQHVTVWQPVLSLTNQ